jgi:nucleoid-associated protein YgaU
MSLYEGLLVVLLAAAQDARPEPPAPRPAPAKQPQGQRLYEVRAGGEILYQLTERVLGDGRRWPEIYRLNPSIQPQWPIRGGTRLRMPPGAMW